jgi:hypothetical protein
MFKSGNSRQEARRLYDAVKNDPDALAGLKRGMVDHLDQRFNVSDNPEATNSVIKSKSFLDFMNKHRDAYKIVFGGQGAQVIEQVESALNRIARAKQTEATGGSNSAQKLAGLAKHGASVAGAGVGTTLFALLGEHLGEHMMNMAGHGGILGSAASIAGAGAGLWVHSLRQAGINTMNDLGREMMLHPDLARSLLKRVDAQHELSILAQRKIGAAIHGAVLADLSQSQQGNVR